MEAKFKVGDKVKLNPECKVGEYYGHITLLDCMVFGGYKEVCAVDVDACGIKDDLGHKWWYSEEMLIKEDKEPSKDFKEVSLSQENITLSRDDFHNVVVEVMSDFMDNPPNSSTGENFGKASFLMAMTVPIIANKIEEKLFGSKEKEEE